ncbi:hypothetical protein T492DRAFT_629457 [Pavlovales sp. CCMP2436]|nr:hypothetical protein T492DRAFT_629457 [Pavlovales sp. CCMP2436]
MQTQMLMLALSGLLLCAGAAAGVSHSVVITGDTFASIVVPEEHWLLEFWAPWCGHCKKLKPIWEEAAEKLGGKVRFGHIDVTTSKALAKRLDIEGYPSILLFHGGQHITYSGDKTVLGFGEFVARMSGPTVHPLASVAEVRKSLGPVGRAFVLAGRAHSLPPALLAAFEATAAQQYDTLNFVTVDSSYAPAALLAMAAKSGGSSGGEESGVAVLGVLDGEWFEPFLPPKEADAQAMEQAVKAWVSEREWQHVVPISSANFWKLRKGDKHLAMLVLDPLDFEGARQQQAQVAAHALDPLLRAAFQFGWIDGTEQREYWQEEFGVSQAALPTLLVLSKKGAYTSASHWRALNGTHPFKGAAEQASFLAQIATKELLPEQSGENFNMGKYFSKAYQSIKEFALEQPFTFAGCVALNLMFLYAMSQAGVGESGAPHERLSAQAASQELKQD